MRLNLSKLLSVEEVLDHNKAAPMRQAERDGANSKGRITPANLEEVGQLLAIVSVRRPFHTIVGICVVDF